MKRVETIEQMVTDVEEYQSGLKEHRVIDYILWIGQLWIVFEPNN